MLKVEGALNTIASGACAKMLGPRPLLFKPRLFGVNDTIRPEFSN